MNSMAVSNETYLYKYKSDHEVDSYVMPSVEIWKWPTFIKLLKWDLEQVQMTSTTGTLRIHSTGQNYTRDERARPSYPTFALDFIREHVETKGPLNIVECAIWLYTHWFWLTTRLTKNRIRDGDIHSHAPRWSKLER